MKVGVCAKYATWSSICKLGPDYLEETVESLLMPEMEDEEYAAHQKMILQLNAPILAVNRFLPAKLKSIGHDVEPDRLITYVNRVFKRAKDLGVRFIVYGSGDSRRRPETYSWEHAFQQFVELLRELGPLAQLYGLTIVIEPLSHPYCNFISSLKEGAEVVEAVNHPSVRLMADICHMLRENEDAGEILKHARWIEHCHLARRDHSVPLEENKEFDDYFQALKSIGYKGGLSLECNWNSLACEVTSGVKFTKKGIMLHE